MYALMHGLEYIDLFETNEEARFYYFILKGNDASREVKIKRVSSLMLM